MTWCVTETHHLSVIQVFELQGCNVARLVRKDLFQIAGPEGQWPYMWEVSLNKNVDVMKQHARIRRWRQKRDMYLITIIYL